MKKLIFLLLFISCNSKIFPPAHSDQTAFLVNIINKSVEDLYTNISLSTDRHYSMFSNNYVSIDSEYSILVRMETIKTNGSILLTLSLDAQKYFLKYENEHRLKDSITAGAASVYQQYMRGFNYNLILAENLNH